jgi:hypothetical protein
LIREYEQEEEGEELKFITSSRIVNKNDTKMYLEGRTENISSFMNEKMPRENTTALNLIRRRKIGCEISMVIICICLKKSLCDTFRSNNNDESDE